MVDHGARGEVAATRARQPLRLFHGGLGLGDPARVHPGLGQLAENGQPRFAGQSGARKKFFITGYPGRVVAASDQRPAQVENELGRRGPAGQVHGRLQVAPRRAHRAGQQRLPPGPGHDVQGLAVPGEPGGHRVAGRLGRVDPAGRQGPERGLVQPGTHRGGQLVHRLTDQLMAELGPALTGVPAQPGSRERFLRRRRIRCRQPGDLGRHLGAETPPQHRGSPQVPLRRLLQAGQVRQQQPARPRRAGRRLPLRDALAGRIAAAT